jgi:hypothetical protein
MIATSFCRAVARVNLFNGKAFGAAEFFLYLAGAFVVVIRQHELPHPRARFRQCGDCLTHTPNPYQ